MTGSVNQPDPEVQDQDLRQEAATEAGSALFAADVARLTSTERIDRVARLVARSHEIMDEAVTAHADGHQIVATALLFSGGNDSTTLAHMMRHRASHAIHANTGIGIEETRQFVRDTCQMWGLPLIEKHPPVSYADLVRERGFPGPAMHWKMYQRLKERGLRQAQRDLVANPRQERVVFIAGRRRDESARRVDVPLHERVGSAIWVSPIAEWTKLDLNTYRLLNDVPTNQVADLLHMSGECLCGSFAKASELEEIGYWYPTVRADIEALEVEIADRPDIPKERRKWGWGIDREVPSRSGAMCSSCVGQLDMFETGSAA
jgi:3'-phosphoadenosine 5'-phosphosulfate sulfotransferase (PAPS reductase)/FAD synthetase